MDIGEKLDFVCRSLTSITGLVEDVIDPMFGGWTCEGFFQCQEEKTGKSRQEIALEWVDRNFDALVSIAFTIETLSRTSSDIVQMLPPMKEMERTEAAQHG